MSVLLPDVSVVATSIFRIFDGLLTELKENDRTNPQVPDSQHSALLYA